MLNVALVGCGRISPCHVDAVKANADRFRIAWVCDRDEAKARALAEELGCGWTCDMFALSGKGIDVASVLTPSGLHPRHLIDLAEKTDIPAFIGEKPLALHAADAEKVFDAFAKAGKRLYPVYQNRYNPIVVRLKEMIDAGAFGRIHQFAFNVYWRRDADYYAIDWHGTRDLDGGVLFTQASHFIDMLHFFFGPLESFRGFTGNHRALDIADSASVSMRFANGAVGTLNATVSVYDADYMTEFTLIAEKGTVRLGGVNLNHIEFWNVEGVGKPALDFEIAHQYGLGHRKLYAHVAEGRGDLFADRATLVSGIRLMETVSGSGPTNEISPFSFDMS